MSPLELTLWGWAAAAVVMALIWFIQLRTGNAGVVDVAWSLGVGLLAVWFAWGADGLPARRALVAALAAVWSARLVVHLVRRLRAEQEDGRYGELRAKWGAATQRNLFLFFQIQASWSVLFALPMLIACRQRPAPGSARRARGRRLAGRPRRRGLGGPSARRLQGRRGQPREGLSVGAVALFAPSQLFLRMGALVGVRGDRMGRAGGLADSARAGCHAPVPHQDHRHPAHRGARRREPRRRLSRVSADHERVLPVAAQAGGRMNDWILSAALSAAERALIPDSILRWGIRRLCAERLEQEKAAGRSVVEFAETMRSGPVAPVPEKANEQHYEAPPEFFERALGPRLKYSCCYWPAGVESLAEAEEAALALTCERAELRDGQRILELGCGWGSLSLWMAETYPASRITAVSNSVEQRRFIEARAADRGLQNLEVVTCDMNRFVARDRFDRVVSVEMFEHMRNYEELLGRVSSWLRPDGKLFVHIFCHRRHAYEFVTDGADNWMGRHFFTGGIMPSFYIFERFQREIRLARSWKWSGVHYQRTANAWLANIDRGRERILEVFAERYGASHATVLLQRWRIFMMACAELWGFAGGEEWIVGHYLLEPAAPRPRDFRDGDR